MIRLLHSLTCVSRDIIDIFAMLLSPAFLEAHIWLTCDHFGISLHHTYCCLLQIKDIRESISDEDGDEATGGLKRGSGDKKRKGDVSLVLLAYQHCSAAMNAPSVKLYCTPTLALPLT